MSRRVVFPLKLKLIVIMTGLLIGSISLYAIFALNLFEKDKSAYIYGNSNEANISFTQNINNYLDSSFERIHILSFMDKGKIEKVLEDYSDIYHLRIRSGNEKGDYFYNKSEIENVGLSIEEYKKIIKSYSLDQNQKFKVISDELISFLILRYKNIENGVEVEVYLDITKLESITSLFSQYDSYILNLDGSEFFKKESHTNIYYQDIIKSKLEEATIVVDELEPKILSFKINTKYKLIFITEILRSEAYKVNDYLISKSKVFGLVLLSLSGFIALLFSRSLTLPLEKLYDFTLSISSGDFDNKVEVKSRDEIGALGDSINFMSDEILRYMDEMKEKARLESEIETARYVQSTYFPKQELDFKNYSISSFYMPASECGGDWWGYIEDEERICIVIADATGHGVPAALLTATAHCCIENLKQSDNEIIKSPAKILEYMNSSIQCLGGKMLMTAFCCVLDKDSGEMLYSNASHNPPLYRPSDFDKSKRNNFKPLLGNVGPRLGHKSRGDYSDESILLEEIERILFFTDGILESKNKDDKEYGQRNFLKSLNRHGDNSNSDFRESIVKDAFDFFEGFPIDDDITIVSLFLKKYDDERVELLDEELARKINARIDMKTRFKVTDKPMNKKNVFFISNNSDYDNIEILMSNPSLNHLIGANSSNVLEEIVHNVNNYNKEMSLGKYLENYRFHNTIVSCKEDFTKINNLLSTLDVDGYFESPIDYLKIITNELLTNAIYHSGEGDVFSERSTMARKNSPVLSDGEDIDYSLAVSPEHIAICVTDFTGRLTREVIVANLERSFREKEYQQKDGGAGLGLFLAFSYSNQFIVRTDPGKSTEVICIIEKNKRFKTYKERITSFHYFEKKDAV